jgi:hypothetical protein
MVQFPDSKSGAVPDNLPGYVVSKQKSFHKEGFES